jgi:polysaccharide biosynthesis/export protein
MDRSWVVRRKFGLLLVVAALGTCGCQTVKTPEEKIAKSNIPTELKKVSMPEYVVEPPDIIIVEVLEALPGRPITGERLVRPDGTISLGFYGEVYVAGLSLTEIKEKVVLHLRKYINDEVLGLVKGELNPEDPLKVDTKPIPVPPRDSDRVFVDVVSFNSKVYYVQGDVGVPGRLPITGNETVLDAINYAGGLIPTASSVNIRLVRPAPPGACCEQTLPVNLAAIINAGDPTTNYQLMPGDRVVVYRDPIVRTSVFLDRLASPFNSVLNSMFQFSITARAVKAINVPINPPTTTGPTIGRGAGNGVTTPVTTNNLSRGAQ